MSEILIVVVVGVLAVTLADLVLERRWRKEREREAQAHLERLKHFYEAEHLRAVNARNATRVQA